MKWFDTQWLQRGCAAWLAAMALPALAQTQGGAAPPAAGAADEAAERMARIQRVASDPIRRVQEAARLGGGVGRPAPAAVPTIQVSVPARRPAVATAPAAQVAPASGSSASAPAMVTARAVTPQNSAAQNTEPQHTVAQSALAAAPEAAAAPRSVVLDAAEAALVPQSVNALAAAALPHALPEPGPMPALAPAAEPPYVAVLLQRVDPEFAGAAPEPGSALRLQLRFSIAADGSVQDLVVQGAADRPLLRAVREAVSRWRYAPPGRLTPHTVELVLRFDT